MKSGIYKIVNQKTGKLYIGSATDIISRWSKHRSTLNNGKHHSILLQRSWNKHGADSFTFEVVEYVEVDALLVKEQYYLDLLTPYIPTCGYNICTIAGSQRGRVTSEETKQKIREKLSGKNAVFYGRFGKDHPSFGRKNSDATIQKMREAQSGDKNHNYGKTGKNSPIARQVVQQTKDGQTVRVWDCLADIGRELGYSIGNISSCCNGRKKSSKGFIWKWLI